MKNRKYLWISISTLMAFILWTLLISVVDVQPIGPWDSAVGLATVNGFVHKGIGVNMPLYHITDWLGLVPVACGFCFAVSGLTQWIRRKHLLKVDRSILVLGCFYILVLVAYLFFEDFVINYRPVLIDNYLEASYPSSTTLLVLCVMPTTVMQLNSRIQNNLLRNIVSKSIMLFVAFMVFGRLLSGVHWFTDIIGGILLSSSLVSMYRYAGKLE